jgi:hypothetical protein
LIFQGTSIVFLPDDGAASPKHVGDTHQIMYAIDIVHSVVIKKGV